MSDAKDSSTTPAAVTPAAGPISQWLKTQGFDHDVLLADHLGVEVLGVEPAVLPLIATALKAYGFDYLQCQGGYDEGP
ncbi:MAG: NAD(P)H-quinone oxidoreductase subunit J, partial [Cyanobacteria bacterium K_DeepCast_35m_m2_023]|nr:NAD(P)H-quinone oxidoreductase subunit J [Cyanobacteria bacterium K_DeepCast_35m_m2_023]